MHQRTQLSCTHTHTHTRYCNYFLQHTGEEEDHKSYLSTFQLHRDDVCFGLMNQLDRNSDGHSSSRLLGQDYLLCTRKFAPSVFFFERRVVID
jgi:hypothetical protein